MAITAAEVQTLAQSEDDFRHELQIGGVMRLFQRNGLESIEHGGAYNDSITGKARQFDFRALIRKGKAEARLAVEGKRINPEAPIIVCGLQRNGSEAFHHLILSGDGTSKGGGRGVHAPFSMTEDRKSDFYCAGGFVGKSVFRAKRGDGKGLLKREGDGEIFERYAQALSSSVELAGRACVAAIQRQPTERFVWSVILPVVVVPEEALWIVKYDNEGNFDGKPEQTDGCEIYTANGIQTGLPDRPDLRHEFRFSHVHILTLRGFSEFLTNLTTGGAWVALFGRQFSIPN
jgi:hypothetical protein